MLSTGYSISIILIMSIITFGLRAAPFILFSRNRTTPKVITYLGNGLPPAVIGMLIIYCVRNVSVQAFPYGLAEMFSIAFVAILHLWRKNTLLSIVGGTLLYMVFVQFIFK